jgi:hypothetical protein
VPARRSGLAAEAEGIVIDAVYTWVDGSDPAWQARQHNALARAVSESQLHHPSSTDASRFKNRDELRYSLRSIERYAPFFRRVFLVTDHQVPDWLTRDHAELRVVFHEEIFPDPAHLPTFNSHAIEAHLHRIPGLSERFVYFNDDVFLAKPCSERDFFDEQGRCVVYLDQRGVVWNEADRGYGRPVSSAARNNSRLLEKTFGFRIEKRVDHTPHALRRSILEEIWERWPDELEATSSHCFRHSEDLSLTSSLAQFYGLCTGRAVSVSEVQLSYIKVKRRSRAWLRQAARLLRQELRPRERRKFLSINDAGELSESWIVDWVISLFLRARYPRKSRFER